MVDSIVIVVSPLNYLRSSQISRLGVGGIRASVMSMKESRKGLDSDDVDSIDDQVVDVDFSQCEGNKLYIKIYNYT